MVDAEVVRLLEEALQLPGPADSALRAMVLARLGNELSFSEQDERKKQLLAEALQVARRLDDPETLAYVLANVGWEDRDAAQGLSLAREQVEAARRAGDKYAELRAHNMLAARISLWVTAPASTRPSRRRSGSSASSGSSTAGRACHHALQARMDGRFEEAERLAGQAFAELQREDPEIAAQGLWSRHIRTPPASGPAAGDGAGDQGQRRAIPGDPRVPRRARRGLQR